MLETSLISVVVAFGLASLLNIDAVYRRIKRLWQQGGGISVAWTLMFFATGLWIYREGSVTGVTSLDAASILQISLVALATIILLFAVLRGASIRLYGVQSWSFFLYGVVAFSSVGVSPAPALTAYKSGLILADLLLVVSAINVLNRSGGRAAMLELTYSLSTVFLLSIVISAILYPDLAVRKIGGVIGYNLNGAFPVLNANDVGFFAAINAALGIRRMWEPRPLRVRLFWVSLAAMGLVVMFFAQARTSIVGLTVVLLIYAIAIKKMRPIAITLAIALVSVGSYYILTSKDAGFEEITGDYLKRGQSEEMVSSLSGREGLWAQGFAMFYDSPLVGNGYEAGVKYGGRAYGIAEGLHMHNAHMQVLVNSGFLGYLAWIVFLGSVTYVVVRRAKFNFPAINAIARYEVEMLGIMLLTLLRTFTGSVLVFHHLSLMLFLGVLVYIKVRPKVEDKAIKEPEENSIRKPGRLLRVKRTGTGKVDQQFI